jgi:hypothetical protein
LGFEGREGATYEVGLGDVVTAQGLLEKMYD